MWSIRWLQYSSHGKKATCKITRKEELLNRIQIALTLDITSPEAWNGGQQFSIAALGMTYRCPMRKQVSLQRSITLSILSIGLLSGALGLAYAYWQTKHSFREAIGVGFQELARQSADKVGLILEKEIEWVERLSSLPQVREAVREGTRLTFDQQVLERWKESQRPYFRSLEILDLRGRSVGGATSEIPRRGTVSNPGGRSSSNSDDYGWGSCASTKRAMGIWKSPSRSLMRLGLCWARSRR